jgi:predicted nucleic acid-binding protein
VDVTRDIASRGVQLRAARQARLPDALVLATAMQVAADQILTLDRRWRGAVRRFGSSSRDRPAAPGDQFTSGLVG